MGSVVVRFPHVSTGKPEVSWDNAKMVILMSKTRLCEKCWKLFRPVIKLERKDCINV